MEQEAINNLITIFLSAGTAAFITVIGNLLGKIIDVHSKRKDKKMERYAKTEDDFRKVKEESYRKGISYLLYLKKLLYISEEDFKHNKETKKEISNLYIEVKDSLALIRLYSSDSVFYYYENLIKYYEPFFLVSENGWKLCEESKQKFDMNIAIMSRLMNKDLGFRSIECEKDETIICPECGKKHSVLENCPKCKMSTFYYINKKSKQSKEKQK